MTPTTGAAAHEMVGTELERVARRWQQLPLGHALSRAPAMRQLVQSLADRVAAAEGREVPEVPDLGPAVLLEQLRVMTYDHRQAGLPAEELAADLTALRRSL